MKKTYRPTNALIVNANTQQAKTEDQPKANVYLHVGYRTNVTDEGGNPYYISTTYGLPLDTMPLAELRGNSQIMNDMRSASNEFTKWLQNEGDNTAPGARTIIQEWEDENGTVWAIWLQRRSEPVANNGAENMFSNPMFAKK